MNFSLYVPEQFLYRVARCRLLACLNTDACQQDRKSHYGTTYSVVSFHPGDEVLLWTLLCTPGLYDKLQCQFIGPYSVLEQPSPVNYHATPVDPPADRCYHRSETVYVSCLKPFLRRTASG